MKHTIIFKLHAAWTLLGTICFVSATAIAGAKDMGCSSTVANPCTGGSPGGGGYSTPSHDYEAARRAQEAAAERQRQQEEADRIERERRAEEKRQKDAAFIRDRDAAANTLKGSSGTNTTQLKGLSGTDNYGLKGSGTDAGAQLKSVERHSRDAQSQGKDTDKETARQGFDTPGRASGNLVYPDKKQRQIPPSALDKRVPPEAQKDPQVQQSLAWYRKLDAQKAEKQKMIAEIKEQKKTSKDPVLDTKIATLNNDVKIIIGDQAKATETVEKRVKNLGFNLVEAPEPTTTNANKK